MAIPKYLTLCLSLSSVSLLAQGFHAFRAVVYRLLAIHAHVQYLAESGRILLLLLFRGQRHKAGN